MYVSLPRKQTHWKATNIGILPFLLFYFGLPSLLFSYFSLVEKCAIAPRKSKLCALCQDLFAFTKKWQQNGAL